SSSHTLRFALASGRPDDPACALTAILEQKIGEIAHGRKIGPVDDRTPLAPRCDEAGARQFLQMEGKGRGRHVQRFRNLACGEPAAVSRRRMGAHEGAKDRKPRFLGERRKSGYGVHHFHYSTIIEMKTTVKGRIAARSGNEIARAWRRGRC